MNPFRPEPPDFETVGKAAGGFLLLLCAVTPVKAFGAWGAAMFLGVLWIAKKALFG